MLLRLNRVLRLQIRWSAGGSRLCNTALRCAPRTWGPGVAAVVHIAYKPCLAIWVLRAGCVMEDLQHESWHYQYEPSMTYFSAEFCRQCTCANPWGVKALSSGCTASNPLILLDSGQLAARHRGPPRIAMLTRLLGKLFPPTLLRLTLATCCLSPLSFPSRDDGLSHHGRFFLSSPT